MALYTPSRFGSVLGRGVGGPLPAAEAVEEHPSASAGRGPLLSGDTGCLPLAMHVPECASRGSTRARRACRAAPRVYLARCWQP